MKKCLKRILKKNKFIHRNSLKILIRFNYEFNRLKMKLHGYIILSELNKILETNNAKYFLDFGTLLGLYRDKKLIKDDFDLDISFLLSETDPSVISKIFLNSGYKKIREFIFRELIFTQQFTKKGIKVDVHYYLSDGESLKTYLFFHAEHDQSLPEGLMNVSEKCINIKLDLTRLEWKGISFSIPRKTSNYLEILYGSNWKKRIKKDKYIYWKSPNTTVLNEFGKVVKN